MKIKGFETAKQAKEAYEYIRSGELDLSDIVGEDYDDVSIEVISED
jgi:hypothetical protein